MQNTFARESVLKNVLRFSLPYLLSYFLQTLYGMADLLLIGGTSLAVYPAAGLIRYYQGRHLVLINKSPTPYDKNADLVIAGPIGAILGEIRV